MSVKICWDGEWYIPESMGVANEISFLPKFYEPQPLPDLVFTLTTGCWIRKHLIVLIGVPTGVGKT